MYQLTENGVIRLSDNAFIPTDLGNRDYADFIAWKAAGNEPLPIPPKSEEQLRAEFKQLRHELVNEIKVTTTAGNVFDGDELSQARMARAILGLQFAGEGAVVTWVLADNTVIQVGIAELQEALMLAGAEQARLWIE